MVLITLNIMINQAVSDFGMETNKFGHMLYVLTIVQGKNYQEPEYSHVGSYDKHFQSWLWLEEIVCKRVSGGRKDIRRKGERMRTYLHLMKIMIMEIFFISCCGKTNFGFPETIGCKTLVMLCKFIFMKYICSDQLHYYLCCLLCCE